MPSLFRDPVLVTYVDADDTELASTTHTEVLPRVGENIRLGKVPYVVERIGYDMPKNSIERVWIVCRRV